MVGEVADPLLELGDGGEGTAADGLLAGLPGRSRSRLVPCVPRPETRRRLQAYLDGLLSDTQSKNGWQLAETVGDVTPYGFQHLLGRAAWSSVAATRDALYTYVAEHLGDSESVVVIDETGFPKQGTHSAGVARPYCGALGKIGNCQVGVFLAYVGSRGHTLLDQELYLPAAGRTTRPGWRK